MEIQRNSPVLRRGKRKSILYPFESMGIRDSFTIETPFPEKKRHCAFVCACRKRIKIATRCTENTLTVWRIG